MFEWAKEESTLCAFLERRGLHKQHVWRRECACEQATPFGCLGMTLDTDLRLSCSTPSASQLSELRSWHAYYSLRALPPTSVAAVCLSTALTLVHSVELCGLTRGRPLVVHLLGAAKELDQLPCFLEAARLLSTPQLHLVLLGPSVPSALQGSTRLSSCGRLRVLYARCDCYDSESAASLPPPDLCFSPNAGVPAYPTEWRRTLEHLKRQPCSLAVSDYAKEAALETQRLIEGGGLHCSVPVRRNPFSGLLPIDCPLPAYSNGWLLCFCSSDVNIR
jgi:hypothetical protein